MVVEERLRAPAPSHHSVQAEGPVLPGLLATSKSGTHWEPRDQGLDGGLVSSLMDLL